MSITGITLQIRKLFFCIKDIKVQISTRSVKWRYPYTRHHESIFVERMYNSTYS